MATIPNKLFKWSQGGITYYQVLPDYNVSSELQRVDNPQEAKDYVAQLRGMGTYRPGDRSGPQFDVQSVANQIEAELAKLQTSPDSGNIAEYVSPWGEKLTNIPQSQITDIEKGWAAGTLLSPEQFRALNVPSTNNTGTIINPSNAPAYDTSGIKSTAKTLSASVQAQVDEIAKQFAKIQEQANQLIAQRTQTTTTPTSTPTPMASSDQSNWDKLMAMFKGGQQQISNLPAVPTLEEATNKYLAGLGYTPESFKKVKDLNDQLTALREQSNNLENQKQQALDTIAGRPGTTIDFNNAETNRVLRSYATQETYLAGKASLLTAQIAALSGDYEKATQAAQNYVTAATAAHTQLVNDIKWSMDFYKDVYSAMDSSERQKVQDALQAARDAETKRHNKAMEEAKTVIGGTNDTKFWSEIDAGKNELQQGATWGEVWNRIKMQFPDVANETIDNALGTYWKTPGAYQNYTAQKKGEGVSQETLVQQNNLQSAFEEDKNAGKTREEIETAYKTQNNTTTIPDGVKQILDQLFPKKKWWESTIDNLLMR